MLSTDKSAYLWHFPHGRPCDICGADIPRLKAKHKLDVGADGPFVLKTIRVCFGTDSALMYWDAQQRLWY